MGFMAASRAGCIQYMLECLAMVYRAAHALNPELASSRPPPPPPGSDSLEEEEEEGLGEEGLPVLGGSEGGVLSPVCGASEDGGDYGGILSPRTRSRALRWVVQTV